MKLSEMDTRQMAEAICKLTEPIGNMVADKACTDALALALQLDQDGTIGEQLAHAAKAVLPQLLGPHLDDLIAVAAALTGKTAKQVAEQRGTETIRDLMDCFDKDLVDFFSSSARTASKA